MLRIRERVDWVKECYGGVIIDIFVFELKGM